ncbi:hypothetical protein L1049_018317 [Liquidambar formosana]|uniref:S-adenosyl-L-methionine-dependent methyltransferase n=1 Tax=Liquidambar formosana TaxID=63359 RepID=A0AAP0R9X4_LIQFO
MKLVWSPETASKAYIDTVKSCGLFKQSGQAEFISAMAGGRNAKLIVEAWSSGGAVTTSAGLVIAAQHTSGRHVCVVPDERSKLEYNEAMHAVAGVSSPEVVVGEAEDAMEGLVDVDFVVVDCRRKDWSRVLRFVKLNQRDAVLVCKNASQRAINSGFRWHGALGSATPVVRSAFLPVGKGLDIAYVGNSGGIMDHRKGSSRWIKHIDQQSGEEHVFRR